jgi:DnaJ-class molecular chaperone
METVSCEECGGKGIDPGSLTEPEACPECNGSGKRYIVGSVYYGMTKPMGKALFHQMQERKLRDAS